jgi:hypothetical protein
LTSPDRDGPALARLQRLRRVLVAALEHPSAEGDLLRTYADVRARLLELHDAGAIELDDFEAYFPLLRCNGQSAWSGRSLEELIRQLEGYIDAIGIHRREP